MTSLDLVAFRAALASGAVPVLADSATPESFRSDVAQANWHDVGVSQVAATAHSVERDEALVDSDTSRGVLVALPLEGETELAQEWRRTRLAPGLMTIIDASTPFRFDFASANRLLVVEFPRERLVLAERRMQELSAAPMPAATGLGGVVASYLVSLGENPALLQGPARARLVLNALDLLGTLLDGDHVGHVADETLVAEDRREWFERVRADIDERLADPNLSPADVAANAHISLRQLYLLFNERGQRVANYIRMRRLERAYLELTDPVSAELSIAAIGAKWGFPSAAHFSRTFRDAYGVTPKAVRGTAED